jgi:feruloyl esterase
MISLLVVVLFAAPPDFKSQCQSFTPARIAGDATLTAKRFEPDSAGRPARCVLHGRIVSSPTSTINFRVDLPAPGAWNTKVLMIGGGGFDGVIPTDDFDFRRTIQMGLSPEKGNAFVVGSTDSGHQGRGEIPEIDYSWAARNPSALRNHAYEANHLVLGAMVSLVTSFYGKAPTRRYHYGVSNGARQGIMAAQRYPADYDGILALAPAISQTAFAANLTPVLKHVYSDPDNWMDQERLRAYVAAEVAACDLLDGVSDGVIGNYRNCRFDPATLACGATKDGNCLTPGQIQSLRMWRGEKRVNVPLADGLGGYAIYGPGGSVQEWAFLFGKTFAGREAFDFIAAENIVKNGITDDPVATVLLHDPEKWASQYLANSELIDATNPDLSGFFSRGGKLLSMHGAGDYCVSYDRMGQYYRAVEARLGNDKTRASFRLFVAPSVGHSMTGAGPEWFTLFPALEAWVEQGKSPDGLVATKKEPDGSVRFTRPLCDYGWYPHYRSGDPAKAGSFECREN